MSNNNWVALERFYRWILKQKAEKLHFYQEYVLTILFLLTDHRFEREVDLIRKKLKVQEEWYAKGLDGMGFKTWFQEWTEWFGKPSVSKILGRMISRLCKDFELDCLRYGYLLEFFVFSGDITPLEPLQVQSVFTGNEFKYKVRIERKYHDGYAREFMPSDYFPTGGYIRFFQDTTKSKLHEFIDKNWKIIKRVQKTFEPYPFSRRRSQYIFKRDVSIFLLHKLGNNAPDIADEIASRFVEQTGENLSKKDEDLFMLYDSNIRKIVSDLTKEINNRVLHKL